MERKNAWKGYKEEQLKELDGLCGAYRKFLDTGKTERECVQETIRQARAAGYISLQEAREASKVLTAGAKVYAVCMNKSIALYRIGSRPMEEGMCILGAHIDSPRLDLKQNPLYEDTDMVYLDTIIMAELRNISG